MSTLFIYSLVKIIGIVMLVTGIVIRYFMKRRRFNRRNQYGAQGFDSYEHRNVTVFGESLMRMVARILILAGLFFIFLVWVNRKMDKRAQQKKQEISTPKKDK